MAPAFGDDVEGGTARRERLAEIDAVEAVAALLDQAAEAMDRSGRSSVAASHRMEARGLRCDA